MTVLLVTMDTYVIVAASMEPTLHCASSANCLGREPHTVVVSEVPFLFGGPSRGDIVVIRGARSRCGGEILVKRIVGLPGETLRQIRGQIYVNNRPLNEEYTRRRWPGREFVLPRIDEGRYFVMGDNRRFSCDSRSFGTIERADISGKVIFDYSGPLPILLF